VLPLYQVVKEDRPVQHFIKSDGVTGAAPACVMELSQSEAIGSSE